MSEEQVDLSWQTAVRALISLVVGGGSAMGAFTVMRRGYNKELIAAGYDPYANRKVQPSAVAHETLIDQVSKISNDNQTIPNRYLYDLQKYAGTVGDNVNRTTFSALFIFIAVFVSIFVTDVALAIANEKNKNKDENVNLPLIFQKATIKSAVSAAFCTLAWIILSISVKPVRSASIWGYSIMIGIIAIGSDSFMENLLLPQTKPK